MNDGNAAAAVLRFLHFGNGSEQEQHLTVAGRRQTRAKPSGKTPLGLGFHRRFFILPLPAEGRIGQHIVKGLALELVVGQSVAVLDEVGIVALDEHIRLADGEGLVVQLLAKGHQFGGSVELMQILLRHRQHTAGAAGRVIDGLGHIVPGQHIVVIVEQDIDHQLDHFSGGIVLSGVLVVRLRESSDNLLKDVAHLQVGDHIRVQVGLGSGELLDDDVEDTLVGHSCDLAVKLELFQNVLDILRETVQIVPEVGLDVIRVIQQPLKGELTGIIKRLARGVAQQHIPHGEILHGFVLLQHRILGVGQDTVEAANHREG